MERKKITEFLGSLLVQEKLSGIGKYWASEVSLDYGTTHVRRVDFMEFKPENQVCVSGIEKGIFVCYEVKSCLDDFNSGHGRNFVGEKNYFVMPMSLYKQVIQDIPYGVGVMVPVPVYRDKMDEFEHPTEFREDLDWKMAVIRTAHLQGRKRPMNELLFCMLRSGH